MSVLCRHCYKNKPTVVILWRKQTFYLHKGECEATFWTWARRKDAERR